MRNAVLGEIWQSDPPRRASYATFRFTKIDSCSNELYAECLPSNLTQIAIFKAENRTEREFWLMNKADMGLYKTKLLSLRQRLRGDVNNLADAALKKTRKEASGDLSTAPIHMADVGSDAYEQEFTLTLMEADEGTLGQIDAALERIRQASYGTCEDCNGKIPKARLHVIPFTPTCVKCAEKRADGQFATDNS